MAHLYKTFAHILAAAAIVILCGFGVETDGILATVLTILGVGAVTTFVVSLGLNWARQMLGIFSAGRLVQISLGLLTAWGSLSIAAWLAPQAVTIYGGLFSAAAMFCVFILLAALTGQINAYRGRPWLPKRRFPGPPPHP